MITMPVQIVVNPTQCLKKPIKANKSAIAKAALTVNNPLSDLSSLVWTALCSLNPDYPVQHNAYLAKGFIDY